MPPLDTGRWSSPAQQYLFTLWAARWLYVGVVTACVAVALLLNVLLPKWYTSRALLSVKSPTSLDSTAMVYEYLQMPAGATQRVPFSPRQFLERLRAIRSVTSVARELKVIERDELLDEKDVKKWVEVEHLEGTDLVHLAVTQPNAALSKQFADLLIARAVALSKEENESDLVTLRSFLEQELTKASAAYEKAEVQASAGSADRSPGGSERAKLELSLSRDAYANVRRRLAALNLILSERQPQIYVIDPPPLPVRPIFPRPVLNISIGIIAGLLLATLIVILRAVMWDEPRRLRKDGDERRVAAVAGSR